jgi:hypothetical protein
MPGVSALNMNCPGFLTVTSTPAGASVYIDGMYQGLTPVNNIEINHGQHSIRLSLNGYFDTTADLPIACETRITKNYPLQKIPITTTPTPAYVTCHAPCECLSPREAAAKLGSGSSQCSASPCGKTIPLGDSLPAIKYCFQPTETPVPAAKIPAKQVIAAKIPAKILAQPGSAGVVPAQKNFQDIPVVPVNPPGNLSPDLGQGQFGSSGLSGTTSGTQPGLVDSIIGFVTNLFAPVKAKPQELGPCGLKAQCSDSLSQNFCTDLNSDNKNCGSCGHVCTGTSCTDGICPEVNQNGKSDDTITVSDAPVVAGVTTPVIPGQPKEGIVEEAGKNDQDADKYTVGGSLLGILNKIFGIGANGSDQTISGTASLPAIDCSAPANTVRFTGTANVPVGTPVQLKIFNAPSSSTHLPLEGILIGTAVIRPDTSWEYTWNGEVPGWTLTDGQDYRIKMMISDSNYVSQIIHYTCHYTPSTVGSNNNQPGSSRYRIAPDIDQGATVFIGEEGLDVTRALLKAQNKPFSSTPDIKTIGWWADASQLSTTLPTKMVDLSARYQNFLVEPSDFVGYTGNWYLYTSGTAAVVSSNPVFTVKDPDINIVIRDFSKYSVVASMGADVTNGVVTQGDMLGFWIDTNLYPALDSQFRSPVYHDQRDGYIDISIQDPSGGIITGVDAINPDSGLPTTQSLLLQNVDKPRYIWGDPLTATVYPARWNTGAMNSKGEYLYPPGTYRVWAESKLNGMSENYKNNGQKYTFRTITYVYTVTIVPRTTPTPTPF